MRRRRLLFLTQTHTVWGGMEWWVHHLAERLIAREWDVYAGLAQGARFSDARAYHAAHPHLRAVVMHAEVGNESSRRLAVIRALRRVDPDVVIPIGIGAAFDAIGHVDSVFIVPVLSLHEPWIANIFERRDSIDLTVPNSRLLERLLLTELDASAVRYIRQGVPRATCARSPRTSRLRAGIVCRLEQVTKRVMDLPEVVDAVGDEGIEFHIFGDGPDRHRLLDRMAGRAVYHGYLTTTELYRVAYPNLDVLLFFSPTEGSPNAVYEAMQNACVPVSSRFLGAASEGILRHDENALMFDVGDVATAAKHLLALAGDPARLERLSTHSVATIASYTDDDMYRAWIDAIETTGSHAHRSPPPGLPPSGRLEAAGISPVIADALRRIARVRFPHRTGWDEWPGSQPVSHETVGSIAAQLKNIERKAIDGE